MSWLRHYAETNVAWQANIKGLGWASPLVLGDRVFVASVWAPRATSSGRTAGSIKGSETGRLRTVCITGWSIAWICRPAAVGKGTPQHEAARAAAPQKHISPFVFDRRSDKF